MKNSNQKLSKIILAALFFILMGISKNVLAYDPIQVNLPNNIQKADLIFRGEVIDIQYRNALDGTPHTFVTYEVDEIFKGMIKSQTLTLQFLGGAQIDENGEVASYLNVSIVPEFDLGDEDILFVRNNTNSICPLISCHNSRLRIIEDQIFTEDGHPIYFDNHGQAKIGQALDLEEVKTHSILNHIKEIQSNKSQSLNTASSQVHFGPFANLQPLNRHHSLNQQTSAAEMDISATDSQELTNLIYDLIEQLHTQTELDEAILTESADLEQEFENTFSLLTQN